MDHEVSGWVANQRSSQREHAPRRGGGSKISMYLAFDGSISVAASIAQLILR